MVAVSVLMSSYNHDHYIAQAIESVLAQTFSDLELVIVDDASTDNSPQIIQAYAEKDPRIKASFHTKNQGISQTANDSMAKATGKYVSYIGSDDLWAPTKLEKQLAVLEKDEDKLVWSEALIINGKGEKTGQSITQLLGATKRCGNLFEELLKEQIIFYQTLIYKREFAKGLQRDTSLKYASDHRYIVELAKKHEFAFVNEPLASYRMHGQNVTSKNQAAWMKERVVLREEFIKEYGNEISNKTKAAILYRIGHAYATLGNQQTAKHYYLQALKTNQPNKETILYLLLAMTAQNGYSQTITKTYYGLLTLF